MGHQYSVVFEHEPDPLRESGGSSDIGSAVRADLPKTVGQVHPTHIQIARNAFLTNLLQLAPIGFHVPERRFASFILLQKE